MGARYERGLLDPDAPAGTSPFDHRVWCIVGDGDLEEGITSEASSLAGLQHLDRLVVIYDDNHISIEGDTAIAFHEDVTERYRAYGWATHRVEMNADGSIDVAGVHAAIDAALAETGRPTFIQVRSTIGWPAPNLQNTGKVHGSALGEPEVRATKEVLGLDPDQHFAFPDDLLARVRANLRHRVDSAARPLGCRVRRLACGASGQRGPARPAAGPRPPRRLRVGRAGLRRRRLGVHPEGLR